MHWQHDWMAALQSITLAAPPGLGSDQDRVRFEVYRASYLANLTSALRDTYPVITRLVGAGYFNAVAQRYLGKHPSTSADIHAFGADFPAFLLGLDSAADLPYLADVARLEWLTHSAFHAEAAEALTAVGLRALPSEAYAELCLLPSVQLLHSEFPVHRIWQVNQENWLGEPAVSLAEGGVRLAVYRDGLEIALLPLSQQAYELASGLWETKDLGSASEYLGDPSRLGHALYELIGAGLMSITHPNFARSAP